MATPAADRCPVCLESCNDAARVMPCLHWFCYTCILRWVETKPECPLCRGRVTSIVHSVQSDDNFEEGVITPPVEPPVVVRPTQGAPGQPAAHRRLTAPQPAAAQLGPRAQVGGLRPGTWAALFRRRPALLQPLQPWLHRELRRICENREEAAAAEWATLSCLLLFGLDETALTRLLENFLGRHTVTFVRQVIDTSLDWCREDIQRHLALGNSHDGEELEGRRAAAPGPAASRLESPASTPVLGTGTERPEAQELPNTSSAALQGRPGSPTSAPTAASKQQEAPPEAAEEAVAGPSTASPARQRSRGRPRRAPKRRASSHEDTSQPSKKPPHPQ